MRREKVKHALMFGFFMFIYKDYAIVQRIRRVIIIRCHGSVA